MPKFTVITVSYNSEKFLRTTMQSVLNQEYKDFEYVVGDDCSRDESWNIINSYNDPRIVSYRNAENIGEYKNREKAISLAQGEYLIFIDGDDVILSHALLTLSSYLALFPNCGMVFMRPWDARILPPVEFKPRDIYRFEFLDRSIIGGNFTLVLFKADVIKRLKFPEFIRSGDTYIQLKISQEHNGLVVADGLTWWRKRKGNATEKLFSDNRHMAETINYRLGLLDNNCPLFPDEVQQAKVNIYGIYLRQILRMIFKLKWRDVFFLMRKIEVPPRYLYTVFTPSKHAEFGNISGDEPFQSI